MKNNVKPRNIECAGEDGICAICVIGENLRDDEPCQYDRWRSENGCPGFECGEQCRLCPEDCEFYGLYPTYPNGCGGWSKEE